MLLLTVSSVALALPGADAQWEVLSDGDPKIECALADGTTWCRSTGFVDQPIAQVAERLENMPKYQELFESIVKIDVLEPDVYRIVLDFPGYLGMSDRDYVARYTRLTEGDTKIYRWQSVADAKAPPEDGIIRLPDMAGEWRLTPEGDRTRVTYLWHGEIAGSFPEGMLGRARMKAGQEALKDIRKASSG